jgi:hypothetical protein
LASDATICEARPAIIDNDQPHKLHTEATGCGRRCPCVRLNARATGRPPSLEATKQSLGPARSSRPAQAIRWERQAR